MTVDAVGDPGPLALAVSLTRDAGVVSGIGAYAGKGEVPLGLAWLKGLQLRLGLANVVAHVDRVLALMEAGILDPAPLVTHHMKLADARRGLGVYDAPRGAEDRSDAVSRSLAALLASLAASRLRAGPRRRRSTGCGGGPADPAPLLLRLPDLGPGYVISRANRSCTMLRSSMPTRAARPRPWVVPRLLDGVPAGLDDAGHAAGSGGRRHPRVRVDTPARADDCALTSTQSCPRAPLPQPQIPAHRRARSG